MSRSRSSSSSSGSSSSSSSSGKSAHSNTRLRATQNLIAAFIIQMAQSLIQTLSPSEQPRAAQADERSSLLGQFPSSRRSSKKTQGADPKVRAWVWGPLTVLFVAALVILLGFFHSLPTALILWLGELPRDPMLAALAILDKAPVLDGHIDLPILVRFKYRNNISDFDLHEPTYGHVDIPRLRSGKVGGFFWSVFVECPDPTIEGEDFLNSTWRVRDTLEQIDVARLLMDKYHDTFQFALTSADIKSALSGGKIAGLLGVEGGHQLGNSLGVLRQYHALGVRYVTLTHTCHNVFADSCGYLKQKEPLHGGLSDFGRILVDEMNRLGILVDLSHTSDATATQALKHSRAPVIWSHSSAREIHDVARNVPDSVLRLIGTGEDQRDAVVMVNFAPQFVAVNGNATVAAVADHIEHIAKIAGKRHVGFGSDFDGIESVPEGLEDVSKYPAVVAELYKRGWDRFDLAGLAGGNLLRVLEGAERVAKDLQAKGTPAALDIYDKRRDMLT